MVKIVSNNSSNLNKVNSNQSTELDYYLNNNPISVIAKKALFTIAQIYRAIPYYSTLLYYKARGQDFYITKSFTIYKYVKIWKALKELKDLAPQTKWFSTKEEGAKEEGGVFIRFAHLMWYTGERPR